MTRGEALTRPTTSMRGPSESLPPGRLLPESAARSAFLDPSAASIAIGVEIGLDLLRHRNGAVVSVRGAHWAAREGDGPMRVTALGHAGLKIEVDGAMLLCDPWFNPEGAFQGLGFSIPRTRHFSHRSCSGPRRS